jgi:1-acyl-sn-glycerol-3-phosphate acyltransferase
MRWWHSFEVIGKENLPPTGPALLLGNHSSLLDLPALLAGNPYDDLAIMAAAGLFRIPLLGSVLRTYDAVPIYRKKSKPASLGTVFAMLKAGRVVAVAVEGARSWDGRLGEVNPVLARVAVAVNVPLVPVAVVGAHRALPRGALLPRKRTIRLVVGPPITLSRKTDGPTSAAAIRDALAELLPDDQKPTTGSGARVAGVDRSTASSEGLVSLDVSPTEEPR